LIQAASNPFAQCSKKTIGFWRGPYRLGVESLGCREHGCLRKLRIHDWVEIDAGDTYCYGEDGNEGKLQRERTLWKYAADMILAAIGKDRLAE